MNQMGTGRLAVTRREALQTAGGIAGAAWLGALLADEPKQKDALAAARGKLPRTIKVIEEAADRFAFLVRELGMGTQIR